MRSATPDPSSHPQKPSALACPFSEKREKDALVLCNPAVLGLQQWHPANHTSLSVPVCHDSGHFTVSFDNTGFDEKVGTDAIEAAVTVYFVAL